MKVAIGTIGGLALIMLLGGAMAMRLTADGGDPTRVHSCVHKVGIVMLVGEKDLCPDSDNWVSRHWSIQGAAGTADTSYWADGIERVTTFTNVGIGSNNPSSRLEVTGGVELDTHLRNDGSTFLGNGCGDNQSVTGVSADGVLICQVFVGEPGIQGDKGDKGDPSATGATGPVGGISGQEIVNKDGASK